MKIGFVSSYFYSRERMNYGPYPLVYNIIEKLSENDDSFIIAGGWPKRPRTEVINNMKVLRCPSVPVDFFNLGFLSIGLFGLKNVLKEKPTILNSQGIAGGFLFKELNVLNNNTPKVLSLKSFTEGWLNKVPYPKSFRTDVEYFIRSKWERLAIKNTDEIIVPSNYFKKELMDFTGKKIHVIPNGINTELFKAKEEKDNNLTLFFAGGESIRKGANLLIDSFIELKKEFKDLKLIIIGSDKLKRFQNRLEENNIKIGKDILCFIRIPNSKIPNYINQADIIVHPSYHETFGTILAEAMACEKPVVATNDTGIAEVVGQSGKLFEAGNTQELTKALKDLLADEQKRLKLGKKGRKRVLKEFRIERVIEAYHKLFNKIA